MKGARSERSVLGAAFGHPDASDAAGGCHPDASEASGGPAFPTRRPRRRDAINKWERGLGELGADFDGSLHVGFHRHAAFPKDSRKNVVPLHTSTTAQSCLSCLNVDTIATAMPMRTRGKTCNWVRIWTDNGTAAQLNAPVCP